MKKNEILRRIPKIDEVLKAGGLELLFAGAGRTVVTEAARSVIQDLRNEILKMSPEELEEFDIQRMDIEAVSNRVIAYMEQEDCNNLYPVINATGTILHTNLGRAPLCKEAVENVAAVSKGYSNLEYDVEAGKRGSRHNIVSKLICELTGAEDAMLVNNNASATMIVLSAMAEGKEVIVSRGELVEIGGAFRIPDIMEQSGATLRDIGTTNKTKPSDYVNAIDDTEKAMRDIPILHMITEPADSMERRANKLAEAIAAKNNRVHAGRRLPPGNDCRPAERTGGEAGGHDPRFPGRGHLGDGTVR